MKKMKLTMRELWMIEAIVSNEFSSNNYDLPSYILSYEDGNVGDSVWSNMLDANGAKHGTKVTGKGISAVVSSLNKKGFARSMGKGNDSTVYVTREGWKAYQEVMRELDLQSGIKYNPNLIVKQPSVKNGIIHITEEGYKKYKDILK